MRHSVLLYMLMALGAIVFFAGCGAKGLQHTGLSGGQQSERDVTILVVHHTAGSASDDVNTLVPAISRLHGKRFKKMEPSLGLTVAYHYLITPSGRVWRTRAESDIGHHAGDWEVNKHSIALTLIGDFSKHRPTKAQVRSLDLMVRRLMRERRIEKVIPHSYCRATLCCGEHLSREIRKLSWGRHF